MTRTRTTLGLIALAGACLPALAQNERINFTTAPTPPRAPAPTSASSTSTVDLLDVTPEHNNHITITSDDNGEVYRVEIKGDQVTASKNGKILEPNRVVRHDDRVVVLRPDGDEEKVFRFRGGPRASVFHSRAGNREMGLPGVQQNQFFAAPGVMIGISLGDPGEALRYHLGLGDEPAILVENVADGIGADRAGVKVYDVIVSIDGSDFADGNILRETLSAKDPGETVELLIARGTKRVELDVELDEYDSDKLSSRLDNTPVVITQRQGGFGAVAPTPPNAPNAFVWSNQRDQVIRQLREKLAQNPQIKRYLDEEQLDQVQRSIEQSLAGIDIDFGFGPGQGWGTLEFQIDGDDKTLVFPKRRAEMEAQRELEMAKRAAEREREAAMREREAIQRQREATDRQREMELRLEEMKAQLEKLSRMLEETDG